MIVTSDQRPLGSLDLRPFSSLMSHEALTLLVLQARDTDEFVMSM